MCTLEKRGPVYLLTLTGATDEHRLSLPLLHSLLSSLHHIRSSHAAANLSPANKSPSVLVLAAEGKFFSNGFDLAWANLAIDTRGPLLTSLLKQTIAALISLPMPTIAAITGHAAAAGLILALSCDYTVMRSDRGVMYLSETDIGLVVPEYFLTVVGRRVGGNGMRDMVLAGRKVKAVEGVEMGLVDRAVEGVDGTVDAALGLGRELVGRGWDGDVYKANRLLTMPEVCREVGVVVSKM